MAHVLLECLANIQEVCDRLHALTDRLPAAKCSWTFVTMMTLTELRIDLSREVVQLLRGEGSAWCERTFLPV